MTNSDGKKIIKEAYLDPFLDMCNVEIMLFRLLDRANAKAILDALDGTIKITKDCPYQTTIHTYQ